jgi:ribosomal protein L13
MFHCHSEERKQIVIMSNSKTNLTGKCSKTIVSIYYYPNEEMKERDGYIYDKTSTKILKLSILIIK